MATRDQLADFESAHAEGLHDDSPREFCPDCARAERELDERIREDRKARPAQYREI